jgi:hypothetical protein
VGGPFGSEGPFASDRRAQLGLIAVDLAANFPAWVRRRKTTYEFVDERTLALRQSVDLTLPQPGWFGTVAPLSEETVYVPLNILVKDPLPGFSVRFADGRSVSALSKRENATLAIDGFARVIEDRTGRNTTPAVRGWLRDVIAAPTAKDGDAAFDRVSARLGRILDMGTEHGTLLKDLRRTFLLMVPLRYQPGTDHVLKIEWTQPFTWSLPGLAGTLRGCASALGLVDKALDLPDLSIGLAMGTHYEFSAPEGVRTLSAQLDTWQYDPVTRKTEHYPKRRVVFLKPRIHLNVSIRDAQNVALCRSDLGRIRLRLRPRRGGTFVAVVAVSWLTALLLWVVANRLGQLDVQTSSAIVLILPVLLAAWLARDDEHAIASRLRSGIRTLGFVVAGLALAATVVIGVGSLHKTPASTPQHVSCTGSNRTGPPIAPSAELTILDCQMPSQESAVPETNHALEVSVRLMAVLATALAVLLAIGLGSTIVATHRAARVDDERHEEPIR